MAQARHRETSPDTNAEFVNIEALLRGTKPYAVKLRELIMQNQATQALPTPPSSPPSGVHVSGSTSRFKIPSLTTRRAACTHLTMERLYGSFKCHNCRQTSPFDWVYSCTQDEMFPEIDAVFVDLATSSPFEPRSVDEVEEVLPSDEMEMEMANPQLSSWMENAIKEGHYSPEQIKTLRAQRQDVIENTRIMLQNFEQSQKDDSNSPSKAEALRSLNTVLDLPLPVNQEVIGKSDFNKAGSKSPPLPEPKLKLYPHCKYRACHHCRPTYRDRAWQCFDEIFSDDCTVDLDVLEAEERPLASVSLLRSISLHGPPPRRPQLRSFDSRSLYTLNDAGQIVLKNSSYWKEPVPPTSVDVVDLRVEPESKGFRESMKRAFKGMLMTHRSHHHADLTSKGKNPAERPSTELDAVEFDVGLYRELNDELLREASDIPLPENDSVDELDLTVQFMDIGGVAITEEAAETGTADIILSV